MTAYLCERAWVGGRVQDDVLVEFDGAAFARVEPGGSHPDAVRLAGLTLPGFANAHSHAFHRALRGRTQRERGTFWTWREQMYDVAERLTPESYHRLARAAYREMVAAGYTSVGEFHYVHHRPDGSAYPERDMEAALESAAADAGIRLSLLDTCYLSSGFGAPPEGAQVRFSDGTAARWAERVGASPAAIHSVRAVPRDQLVVFRDRSAPLHVHLSEQVAENEACLAAYGLTPTELLHEEGLLGSLTSVVHATHLTERDIELLGASGTNVCVTPTTERDLGDGIGPIRRLHEAGCRVSIGSDSHAVVDPFEEMRAVELDERLATQRRGHWTAAELLDMGAAHDVLGFPAQGIEVGAVADLVTIDTRSPRTAGTGADEHTAVFAATAADVVHVVAAGRVIDLDRETIGAELDDAIGALL